MLTARTSYHDFQGTVEADITDHSKPKPNDLSSIIYKYNIEQGYDAVGLHWYHGIRFNTDAINLTVILQHKTNKNLVKKRIELSVKDFFEMFKQFDLYLWQRYVKLPDEYQHIDHIPNLEEED